MQILSSSMLVTNEMAPNCVDGLADWHTLLLLFLLLTMSLTLPVDPKKNAKRAYHVEAKFSWDRRLTFVAKIITIIILNLSFPGNCLVHRCTPPHTPTQLLLLC